MAGRIVILNGVPRAGKSSLAQAIQTSVEGRWMIWGVDGFNATLPPELLPGIGLRPGGERPDLEAHLPELFERYCGVLLGLAQSGCDVVADLGLHRDYAAPFDSKALLAERLSGIAVYFIGVDCKTEIIMERRNADSQNGLYANGPGISALLKRWQAAVHSGTRYDLRLDMGVLSPAEGANRIAALLMSPPSTPVFAAS